MNYGIVLFIYNRPQCTKRVLDSLKENNIKELYVFQDGLDKEENRIAWEENEELIREINWCTVYFQQNEKKAKSLDLQIVSKIEEVFCEKDAIIVIEDDCVIGNDCIEFMKSCLAKYKNNEKVIEICGWLEPISIPDDYQLPVIVTTRVGGQMWGTWKNRWDNLKRDYDIIKQIGDSMDNNDDFCILGGDIKKILVDDVKGALSTWDFYWAINLFVKKGYSIRPAFNKVYNIGFENPGTHTSGYSPLVVPVSDKKLDLNKLPDNIYMENWVRTEMGKFYDSLIGVAFEEKLVYYRSCLQKWVKLKQQGKSIGKYLIDQNISSLVIFGAGEETKLIIDDLRNDIDIEYVLVTNMSNNQLVAGGGINVYDKPQYRKNTMMDLLIIPGYDKQKIIKILDMKFIRNVWTLHELLDI